MNPILDTETRVCFNGGMDSNTLNPTQLDEAREWISDCFDDAPADLTDAEVEAAIERHYDRGIVGFSADHPELCDHGREVDPIHGYADCFECDNEPEPTPAPLVPAQDLLSDEPRLARLIEDRWVEAFAQWELGRMSSPSSYDLLHYACLVVAVHPGTLDFDRVADHLWDLQQEGYDLLDLARWTVVQLRVGSIR